MRATRGVSGRLTSVAVVALTRIEYILLDPFWRDTTKGLEPARVIDLRSIPVPRADGRTLLAVNTDHPHRPHTGATALRVAGTLRVHVEQGLTLDQRLEFDAHGSTFTAIAAASSAVGVGGGTPATSCSS